MLPKNIIQSIRTILAQAEVSKKYETKSQAITEKREVSVAIIHTPLRFFERLRPIFAGRTRNAPRSITPNIFTEKAIKSAR